MLRVTNAERAVDANRRLRRILARLGQRDVRGKVFWAPGQRELRVKLVEPQRERHQGVLVEEATGTERVVRHHRIREGVFLHDDRLTAIDERRAIRHRAQDANDGHVEQQVAQLANVALLGRERQLPPPLLGSLVDAIAIPGDRA